MGHLLRHLGRLFSLLGGYLRSMLTDDATATPSFGKTTALFFLISTWAVGTAWGVHLLRRAEDPNDWMWTMAGISMLLYGTYKGGNLISRGKDGKVQVNAAHAESDAPPRPEP